MKVAVVGAGVGGLAVAGHAGLLGCKVAVHDVREEAVAAVRARGGIEVRGKETGFAPVVAATTDVGEAVEGADLVVVTTQGPEQGAAAASMAPHLTPGQVVLVKPGCTFGALEVRTVLEDGGADDIAVAETDSFAYGCAIPEPGVSEISSVKKRFGVAVLPPGRREEIVGLVRRLFDTAEAAPSVLHSGLSNMNAILHVAPVVVNAGRIESGSPFDYYGEGITPSVARVVQVIDDERIAVARALQIEVPMIQGWVRTTYGVEGDDLFEIIQSLHRDVYGPLAAPTSLRQRYLTEDVPCGAVPVADLGRLIGVATPVTSACITVADALSGTTWVEDGRTMERVGLSKLSAGAIRERLVG
ncbi:MAG: NAD/NADP octopine/nopaline dehydrogenase family protein [Actinomycetota bacterium]